MDALVKSRPIGTLAALGQRFDAAYAEYRAKAAICDAAIDGCEKAMTADGIRYGSREWAGRRFAECGILIRETNALRAQLDDVAHEIACELPMTLDDLFVKAKARLHEDAPADILSDILSLIARSPA